eukprot:6127027-Amphidinium_carterae.1
MPASQEQHAKREWLHGPYEQQALLRQLQLEEEVERREMAARNVASLQSATKLVDHFNPDQESLAAKRAVEKKLMERDAVERTQQEAHARHHAAEKTEAAAVIKEASAHQRRHYGGTERGSASGASVQQRAVHESAEANGPRQEQLLDDAQGGHVAAGIAQHARLIRAASVAEEYADWAKVGALMAQKMAAEAAHARDKVLQRYSRTYSTDLTEPQE